MNKADLLKELRALTQAGMKDCNDALKEAENNLQKAIDIIKTKGKNIVSGREGKIAAEGLVAIANIDSTFGMIEINCQTDFVAKHDGLIDFANQSVLSVINHTLDNKVFSPLLLEEAQHALISLFKENIVVRRWWIEQAFDPKVKIFSYIHPNNKIGVLLSLLATSLEAANSKFFAEIGADLAMQIAAMSPLSISQDKLPIDIVNRQKDIFEAQIKELNKPQIQCSRIIDGKFNKWYTEVCLSKQESIVFPKKSIEQLIKNEYAHKLGGELEIISFSRCQVGEGIEKSKDDAFSIEVAKLSNVPPANCPTSEKGVCNHTHTK